MAGSLTDPIARVNRAVHHYHALKDSFYGVDHKLWPVVGVRSNDGLQYKFHIGEIEPLDPNWSLVLGEAYHNLRAALDHLVFQLHMRRYRGKVPTSVTKASAFPIRTCRPTIRKTGRPLPPDKWDTIGTLGKAERAAIERLQPYRGWGSEYPPRTVVGQMRRGIFDINKLDNIDKHRNLHLATIAMRSIATPTFPVRYGFESKPAFGVPLESGAQVDLWTFREAPPVDDVNAQIYIEVCVSIAPGIDPNGVGIDVLPHLGGSIHVVSMVLDRFRDRFPPADGPDLSMVQGTSG